MAEKKANWARDLLLLPLVVGVIVAFVTIVLPKLFEKDKELSYSIDMPVEYLDQEAVRNIDIQVNGVAVSSLFAYKVHIWNSGDIPLKQLPIRFVFNTTKDDFKIFNTLHSTEPKYEFGKIKEEGSDAKSRRFIYELLNPSDKDIVTFLCNHSSMLEVHAKAEGLIVKRDKPQKTIMVDVATILLSVISAFFALYFKFLVDGQSKFSLWIRNYFY